jgi:hypothetical protein
MKRSGINRTAEFSRFVSNYERDKQKEPYVAKPPNQLPLPPSQEPQRVRPPPAYAAYHRTAVAIVFIPFILYILFYVLQTIVRKFSVRDYQFSCNPLKG